MKISTQKKKTIKIAIVSDAIYPYNKGGKEKRIYEISTRLAAMGYDVHIYCMKWWKGNETHRIENRVHLHAISQLHSLYAGERRSISQAVYFAFSCLKLIKEDFDVIDVDHMPHLVLFSLKFVTMIKRKKLTTTWNEVWGHTYWKTYLGKLGSVAFLIEWMTARFPDRIIAVSTHTKEKLKNDLRIKTPITVIPNGIDFANIAQVKPSKITSDIIFAGRLLSHKNVDVLIKAVKILQKSYPKITALIIGEGPEKKKLTALIKENNLEKNVKLLGFLEKHGDLYALMKSSKVFVFPSSREGFGIAALEANACGIPVITAKHKDNATTELIKQGENGYVVNTTPEAIAEKTAQILKKPLQNHYLPYIQKYHWQHISESVEKVYTQ